MSASAKRRAIEVLAARDGMRCWYCGESFDQGARRRSIDHVVAWSRGGTNAIGNLRLACLACNTAKGDGGATDSAGANPSRAPARFPSPNPARP